jgi:DNA (cytosine-5)-methyltransferase 1
MKAHIDLFSGIGGFALAALWAGFETIVFCEKDKYCQKVLNKHWPNVPIIEDIHEFKGSDYTGATILTAGVPCQPASTAGKRRGKEDDRWLWGETIQAISTSNPLWIILENVRGLLTLEGGVVFDELLTQLEDIGYPTRTFIIPACAVNAPHRRDRVWVVAHRNSSRELQQKGIKSNKWGWIGNGSKKVITNNDSTRLSHRKSLKESPQIRKTTYRSDWWSIEPQVDRVVPGLRGRVDRLKGLGNAIVPQVAYQILKGIAEIEEQGG